MSAIAEKVAAEHRPLAASNGASRGLSVRCSCSPIWHEDYVGHVAEVTEAAVRAKIAADLGGPFDGTEGLDSFTLAWAIARIEKGGEPR